MTAATSLWPTRRPTHTMRGVADRTLTDGRSETVPSEPGGMTTMSPFSPRRSRTPFRLEGDTATMVRSR